MEQQAVEAVSYFHGTFWALVPSIVAIILALITKEAYSSLFVGVLIGGLFISQGVFRIFGCGVQERNGQTGVGPVECGHSVFLGDAWRNGCPHE